MASQSAGGGTEAVSLRHGIRCVPDGGATVEEVLKAVGEQVGSENLAYASRMNKAVVVFLKKESLVSKVMASGVWVKGVMVPVSLLSAPATRFVVSNVPPFIKNEALVTELARFGKFASGFKPIALGCKDPALKHVLSLRRQVFMYLRSAEQTLNVSFAVKFAESSYLVYASTDSLRCFECGDIGHKRFACPHSKGESSGRADRAAARAEGAGAAERQVPGGGEGGSGEVNTEPQAARGEQGQEGREEEAGTEEQAAGGEAEQTGETMEAEGAETGPVVAEGGAGPSQETAVNGGEVAQQEQVGRSEDGRTAKRQKTNVCVQEGISVELSQPESACPSDLECSQEGPEETAAMEGSQQEMGELMETGIESEGEGSESEDEDEEEERGEEEDIYSVRELNVFLNQTKNKRNVQLSRFFPDSEKFLRSVKYVNTLQNSRPLSPRKKFRLNKWVTIVRKGSNSQTD